MSVQERVRMCQLINQMESKGTFCKRLGLENRSTFHGNPVNENYERRNDK